MQKLSTQKFLSSVTAVDRIKEFLQNKCESQNTTYNDDQMQRQNYSAYAHFLNMHEFYADKTKL